MAKPSGRKTSQFKLSQGQPQPSVPYLENSFVAGLKTEYTGLNFPEHACTATQNCTFTRVGNVMRRNGIDYEAGFATSSIGITNQAISTFIWTNAGGDGNTKIYVVQVGQNLYFYNITNATVLSPLSTTKLATVLPMVNNATVECQFASGNGYLFVFNSTNDPFYCTYSAGTINSFGITIQVRDFVGISEPGVADNVRPGALSAEHQYNLQNQGWTQGSAWIANSTTMAIPFNTPMTFSLGNTSFTVASGITGISNGQAVTVSGYIFTNGTHVNINASGIVNSYSGTTLVINITSSSSSSGTPWSIGATEAWTITPSNTGYISTWFSAVGNYPSNADVWWTFKNSSNVFAPSTTVNNVTLGSGPAPKGFYILNAFNQQRSVLSAIAGLTDVTTTSRPKTGAWFQGRVWYSGVDSSFNPSGDEPFSTWTENIYFSQIVTSTAQFSRCYQTNDPTSETLFDLLPSDGGVITIQGSGSIYKLFPMQNGVLVFAANGIWFITGSSGIGFTATDYVVTKVSGEHALSPTSFVDVQGSPIFWNADNIYTVVPGQSYTSGQRGLEVKNLTLPTIKSFYQSIPLSSKQYARGSYNHLTGTIQWLYKSTQETGIGDRYKFDSILNFLTYTEAFYNWTISSGATIIGLDFVDYINSAPAPTFKYLTNTNSNTITFSEERDNINWQDWNSSGTLVNYISSFTTSYSLKGQGQRKFQPQYIYMYSEIPTYQYKIQGIWDFAATPASNRFSTEQIIIGNKPFYSKDLRRIRIRGNGYVLQYNITSVTGKPFSFAGWSVLDTIGIQ